MPRAPLACLVAIALAAPAFAQVGTTHASAAANAAASTSGTAPASAAMPAGAASDPAGLRLPSRLMTGAGSGQPPYGATSIGTGNKRVAGLSPQTTLSNAGQPAGAPLGPDR